MGEGRVFRPKGGLLKVEDVRLRKGREGREGKGGKVREDQKKKNPWQSMNLSLKPVQPA